MINLPHGGPGAQFDEQDLIDHILTTGRNFIIQGQTNCALSEHRKPQSLDVWLRVNCTDRQDTKQAVNTIIDDLVETGRFEVHHGLICPDTERACKGIRLV